MDDSPGAARSTQARRPPDYAQPASKNTPAVRNPESSEGNIKDTIESILVAFILAFIFRAFVVEAFVIPTGSMAPTLMGAHMRFRCDDCGYEWTVNYSGGGEGDDVIIPSRASDTVVDRAGNRLADANG